MCAGEGYTLCSIDTHTHSDGDSAGSYHVRVGLQNEASLFPPLLSVVVLKHIAQTLRNKLEVREGRVLVGGGGLTDSQDSR